MHVSYVVMNLVNVQTHGNNNRRPISHLHRAMQRSQYSAAVLIRSCGEEGNPRADGEMQTNLAVNVCEASNIDCSSPT